MFAFFESMFELLFFCLFELQGAELMSKYGINVPRGAAVSSLEQLKDTIKNVFPSESQVYFHWYTNKMEFFVCFLF